MLGWGHKPTAAQARAFAERHRLPYIALEDGFLRSLRLGRDGEPPMSLVADPVGIYYDARGPSLLENLLQEGGWETPELLERSASVRAWLAAERLSKYNHAPDVSPWSDADMERVLVVDQTRDDASVSGGLADESSFRRMLEAALAENPDAEVVVKTHPEVAAGHRGGYFGTLPQHPRLRLLAQDLHPWAVLDGVSTVYTATSLLGCEALLAGKRVRCFGLPFYAGWGLTQDELHCPRRTRKRSLEELFAAAYLLYPRYVDPLTGKRCEIERIIALLSDRRRHWLRCRGATVCGGVSPWKRRFLPDFIGTGRKEVVFVRGPKKALEKAAKQGTRWTLWASQETPELRKRAETAGVAMMRVEDAFVRSAGLGSDLVRPWSLVLDDLGIYYDAGRPSRLEELLRETRFSTGLLARARSLINFIVTQGATKYNIGSGQPLDLATGGRTVVLVPGQVEDDASIRLGSPWIATNRELLQRVREKRPEAFIVFKPHPDVAAGNRRGAVPEAEARRFCDAVVAEVSMDRLLKEVDEVHTLTSLTGFEALLRNRRVVTYGLPFYAGWGLTEDQLPAPARGRKLTIEELAAGALILYPVYVDPRTRRIGSPEHLLEWLAARPGSVPGPSLTTRLIRFFQALRQGDRGKT